MGLKEQGKQNYLIDLLTAREGWFQVSLTAVVLSEFFKPSILNGLGYATSLFSDIEPNLKLFCFVKVTFV